MPRGNQLHRRGGIMDPANDDDDDDNASLSHSSAPLVVVFIFVFVSSSSSLEFDKPNMLNVWTLRLTQLVHEVGKEDAATELHPGRYLHHTKISKGYKPLLQGLVDKADQLKVPSFLFMNISYREYITISYR
jgi:hypothetical protein